MALTRLRRLFANRRGNVALIFALLTPLLVLAAGGTIDVVHASMRQAQLQAAVDAAGVGAVARTSPGYKYALNMPVDGLVPDTITLTGAQGLFAANWRGWNDTTVSAVFGNACGGSTLVCKQGTAVKSNVQATGVFKTSFLSLIGHPTISLNAISQTVDNTPTYINYYVIVDISQSMGIASTPADMANLYNRVAASGNGSGYETGCVFGCHVAAPSTIHSGNQYFTNEQLAHDISPKITLRIDSAVTALQGIISQASASTNGYGNVKIGLYTMSQDPVTNVLVNTVSPPTADFNTLSGLAGSIDLGNNNSAGFGDSDFTDQINTFSNMIPANGTGGVGSPLNYVFIVSDGLADSCQNSHCDGAFSSALCNQLQAKSTVGVIYTTYVPITDQAGSPSYNPNITAGEGNYNRLVVPYLNSIPQNLQQCASSQNLYFQASQGPEIVSAMAQLFAETQKTARIAQ